MKTNQLIISLTFIFLIGIYGCAPVYLPNVVNTPMLSDKGELQAAIYTGVSGFDPQFAYAITDHLGVMLNASFANLSKDNNDNLKKYQFIETGVGYYTKIKESGRFETFGGLGYANLNLLNSNNIYSYRFFIQPSIGAVSDFFDGSFSTRFVLLSISKDNFNYKNFFIEPVITAKVGYKFIKAVFQIGLSLPLHSSSPSYECQPLLFSIGLQAKINTRVRK